MEVTGDLTSALGAKSLQERVGADGQTVERKLLVQVSVLKGRIEQRGRRPGGGLVTGPPVRGWTAQIEGRGFCVRPAVPCKLPLAYSVQRTSACPWSLKAGRKPGQQRIVVETWDGRVLSTVVDTQGLQEAWRADCARPLGRGGCPPMGEHSCVGQKKGERGQARWGVGLENQG